MYVQSKKLKCGLWAGNAKDMTLKCTDGQSKHNPTEIKSKEKKVKSDEYSHLNSKLRVETCLLITVEDGIATRSIGRIGPLHVIERTNLDRRTPAIAALMPRAFDPKGYRCLHFVHYIEYDNKGDVKLATGLEIGPGFGNRPTYGLSF